MGICGICCFLHLANTSDQESPWAGATSLVGYLAGATHHLSSYSDWTPLSPPSGTERSLCELPGAKTPSWGTLRDTKEEWVLTFRRCNLFHGFRFFSCAGTFCPGAKLSRHDVQRYKEGLTGYQRKSSRQFVENLLRFLPAFGRMQAQIRIMLNVTPVHNQ